MGLFKNIFHAATKDWKNANAQMKSVMKFERIEKGEKVLAPKHQREVEPFERAANDQKLKELIDKKDDNLIENVNKIKIESTDPPERWTSIKNLPTRETEWEHRNDPTWEYGYFEPSLEKMEPNRLMLREALDVLRNRMEHELPGPDGNKRPFADEALKKYQSHPAVNRIDEDKLERLWQYFRPFERTDIQRVVRKEDIENLKKFMIGEDELTHTEYAPILAAMKDKKDQTKRLAFISKLMKMESKERKEYLKNIAEKQQADKKRLDARLEDMKLLDSEFKNAAEKDEESDPTGEKEKLTKKQ